MDSKKEKREGYGKILDAWIAPDNAGDPVGCLATSYTFSPESSPCAHEDALPHRTL